MTGTPRRRGPRRASFLQRGQWPWLRDAPPSAAFAARALLGSGTVDDDRLARAVADVADAVPLLRTTFVEDDAGLWLRADGNGAALIRTDLRGDDEPHARCVALLRADRGRPTDPERGPLVRFHLVRLTGHDVVLGVVAHRLLLDARSLYMVLGAVWQAYFGRFRPAQYRDFAEVVDFHPLDRENVVAARRRWWSRRLPPLRDHPAGEAPARENRTSRLRITGARWRALTELGGPVGGNGSLALAALTAWWLHAHGARGDKPHFSAELDLRDHLELGPVIGPLTDRLVFGVDLAGLRDPSFRDVMLRTQTGFLDAVVHYLPYHDVVGLAVELGVAVPPRVAARWDTAVHFCRNAPSSSLTRGERSLAELGVSIELFREADLLGAGNAARADRWDGTNLDLSVGELGEDKVIVFDHNRLQPDRPATFGLLPGLDAAIERAVTDPAAPLTTEIIRAGANGDGEITGGEITDREIVRRNDR